MINAINTLLSLLRRDERAVVNIYQAFISYARILSRTNMINFGYWTQETTSIKQAQEALCTLTGNLAELDTAKNVLDIGSGLLGPAEQWNLEYKFINSLVCIDVNYQALKISLALYGKNDHNNKVLVEPSVKTEVTNEKYITNHDRVVLSRVNATATCLPFGDSFTDRIIALESAQHFKSFLEFIRESHRVLKKTGLIVVAIPVITSTKPNEISRIKILNSLRNLRILGILSLTWASQHYELEQIKSVISEEHFVIKDILRIGKSVYVPLTDFYIQDRNEFRKNVLGKHSSFLKKIALDITEKIVYRSALKMKKLSLSGDIDYVLIKATKK
ncbi:MAG TPA: methyltransferase domain-containing protein [Nitrososphaeraceae archaeon]|nr:methyltransferase domain-containing protein [Nitrososphaeraceae archaeon]